MVITGKYNTLDINISKWPMEDIRGSLTLAEKTENVIKVTIFVRTK
jgi:hypothetical protein